jgi:hypothetical protein
MATEWFIEYGIGGFCEHCAPEHDHPLNNIVYAKEVEVPDEV